MSRIYTRTGDQGETALIGGARAPKSDVRVDLYGTADELNAQLGLVSALLDRPDHEDPAQAAAATRLMGEIAGIQSRLFDLGALLADPDRCTALARSGEAVADLAPDDLEQSIDAMDADLQPLRTFILPGGTPPAATLHVARTVCRRLERRAVEASATIAVPADAVRWLNRLSDWLFTAARWAQHTAGRPDIPWTPAKDAE